ncbi:MAG: hypothetical protein U1D99_00330, partial [Candidatus Omnitrophota bacterium]|nr:hypothetical protein [Candidatus Omnitrophota bacterium]
PAALEKDALGYVKDITLGVEDVRKKVVEAQAAAKHDMMIKVDVERLVAAAEELAKQEGYAAGLAKGLEAGRKAAQARIMEIMEICSPAALEKDALGYVKDITLGVEDVRKKVVEAQAAAADKKKIRSTVGEDGNEED